MKAQVTYLRRRAQTWCSQHPLRDEDEKLDEEEKKRVLDEEPVYTGANMDILAWWRCMAQESVGAYAWTKYVVQLALIAVSSAASERVMSLLKHFRQGSTARALQDLVKTSTMCAYNDNQRLGLRVRKSKRRSALSR